LAVTKLKLMNISGDMSELTPVLYMCLNDPHLHVEEAQSVIHGIKQPAYSNEGNPYKELSASIENLAAAANIDLVSKLKSGKSKQVSETETETDIEKKLGLNIDVTQYLIKTQTEKLKKKNDEIINANNFVNENRRILEQLEHISNISANLDSLFRFEFFKFRFGHMPRETYDSITMYGVADMDDVFFIPSSIEGNEVWGIYFTPRTKSVKVDSTFSMLHFERVRISEKAHGTPENARIELTKEIEATTNKISVLNKGLTEIITQTNELIDLYYEKIYLLFNIYELKKKTVQTNSGFQLMVWIPESHVSKFSKQLAKFPNVVSPVNSPSDITSVKPPTLLKNFILFKPFEQFVKMYGLPSYNEIDPTPFMALTYILFFGIMFGDVGQGLIISAAGFLLWHFKKINLGRIAGVLGLSSMVFGVIFGSVFGLEDVIHGYNPLEHINTVLLAAVGLGMAVISCAIIINILNGIKQRNIEKIFFSQNGLAGLIFYWAVIIAALVMMKFVPIKISVAILIGLVVLCIAIIYLREPLANIAARKSKIIPHNPVEFFIVNFFELFEIILSFLTNTISFIRVGAFALNHVGMMSVVILLSGSASGSTNPVVLIVGNIVVIALEGLIVGIQCLRLQYYEIFGRFFEGDGRSFEPSEYSGKK